MYVAINIWSRFSVKPTKSNQEHVFKDNNADLLRIKRVKKNALEYILGSIYTSNQYDTAWSRFKHYISTLYPLLMLKSRMVN